LRLLRSKRWLALAVCVLAALACNITTQEENNPDPAQTGDLVDDFAGPPPTVQILAPASGQQTVIGDDVEIRVLATDSRGVDRLQLNVSGRTSSSKSFPEAATTAEALLRWRPDREGIFELSVVAFRHSVPSQPATLTLEVVGRSDPITNPVTGQAVVTTNTGDCVGRVLIGNLRMRSGPGTGFDNLGSFELNETVTVVGQNGDSSWVNVRRLDNSQNWVIKNPEWIELNGSCAALPVTG
jgi:hypothetical protein